MCTLVGRFCISSGSTSLAHTYQSPCFFDGSGPIRCLASDAPENSTSDAPEIGKSGFSDFRKSGFSEIRKSGNLKIRIFGFPEIRIFGNRISEIPENPKIRIFGYSDFPDFRKIGTSKNPVKKASDVDGFMGLAGVPIDTNLLGG